MSKKVNTGAAAFLVGAAFTGVVSAQDNIPPELQKLSVSLDEGACKTITVLNGANDPDGDNADMHLIDAQQQDPIPVTAVVNADDTLQLCVGYNQLGSTSVLYTVRDEHGGESTQRINITINEVADEPDPEPENNQKPILQKHNLTLRENEFLSDYNVMSGAYDLDGDDIFLVGYQDLSIGSASINLDNNTINLWVDTGVVPDGEEQLNSSFLYSVTDEHGAVSTQRVNVTILPEDLFAVNHPPVYDGQKFSATIMEGVPYTMCFDSALSDQDADDYIMIFTPVVPFGSVYPSGACLEMTAFSGSSVTTYPKQSGPGQYRFYVSAYDNHEEPAVGGQIPVDVTIMPRPVLQNFKAMSLNDAGYSPESPSVSLEVNANNQIVVSFEEPVRNTLGGCLSEEEQVTMYIFNYYSENFMGDLNYPPDSPYLSCTDVRQHPCDSDEQLKRCSFYLDAGEDPEYLEMIYPVVSGP